MEVRRVLLTCLGEESGEMREEGGATYLSSTLDILSMPTNERGVLAVRRHSGCDCGDLFGGLLVADVSWCF